MRVRLIKKSGMPKIQLTIVAGAMAFALLLLLRLIEYLGRRDDHLGALPPIAKKIIEKNSRMKLIQLLDD